MMMLIFDFVIVDVSMESAMTMLMFVMLCLCG